MARVIIDDTALADALARLNTAIAERREAAQALKTAIHTPGEDAALTAWRAARERQAVEEGVVAWEAKFALECATPAPDVETDVETDGYVIVARDGTETFHPITPQETR